MDSPRSRGIVVFGGGTATNSIVDIFDDLRQSRNCSLTYVIPISDNGGSTSEIIRVLGGPGIGDLRSRLVRLIPKSSSDTDLAATKALFNGRLSSHSEDARAQWLDLVEGRHNLWRHVPSDKRELVRSFFNHVNLEIVKRARPGNTFDFARAAVGNLFLTGARLFSGSLESSIYLLSQICEIPPSTMVLPSINSNFTHHISAGLADGSVITGQNAISHPSAPTSLPDDARLARREDMDDGDWVEDESLPGSLPSLRQQNIEFSKVAEEDLPTRVQKVWYIDPYGHEIMPYANPKVVEAIQGSSTVIYSIGSLYTSIVPSLIVRGVGRAIASSPGVQQKVLILNSSVDRETGPSSNPLTATDFVLAIAKAAAQSQGLQTKREDLDSAFVRRYVTHLIHLDGDGTPEVDREELQRLGVDCLRVYGRRVDGLLRYDEDALARALMAVVGRGEMGRSRRNTDL
ncbi:UPF0052-domain-containing protein [Pleurostoma richardsiae]|uniref:UPF0052-domain-containing protein n=1 Tax=Pleurostoma richardsiae TaxID=41990 RepID=A0AA38RZ55_9PEZI|nr:UPF0052-domain-containing protein [Pleurostoma richardsiae]